MTPTLTLFRIIVWRAVIAGVILVPLQVLTRQAVAGSAEEARFRREFPAAVKRWDAYLSRIKGKAHKTWTDSGGIENHEETLIFASDHGFRKAEATVLKGKKPVKNPERFVYCARPTEGFRLWWREGATTFELTSTNVWTGDNNSSYMNNFGRFLESPYKVTGIDIVTDIMKKEKFRVVTANMEANDPSIMFVHMDYEHFETIYFLKIRFKPDDSWAIQSLECNSSKAPEYAAFRSNVQYGGERIDGMPTMQSVHGTDWGGVPYQFDVEEISREGTPAEEFEIGFYGLPTPMPIYSESSRPWVMWVVIAILGLIVAAGLRYLVVRREQRGRFA